MQLLMDRYRLVERLGAGGMSVVWRAYDQVLGRHVAVKVLSGKYVADAASRNVIRAEAKAAARVSHPHLTNVYDYGESQQPDGTTVPFVVMELVEGSTLAERLARGPIPWRTALRVCAEVAAGLAAAHDSGLVHRDVKPANVMLTGAGAKVVDFGIAAVVGEQVDDGEDGVLLGTPAYLAPERLQGGPVTPATDVYGIGLLLYRVVSGRLPWRAETTTQMIEAHCRAAPAPMSAVDGLPPEVADLCSRCLRKDPTERPASADVARLLAAAVGASPAADQPPARSRWTRLVRAGAVAATVVVGGLIGMAYVQTGDRQGRPDAVAAAPGHFGGNAPACEVHYSTRRDAGNAFAADLALANTRPHPLAGWTLTFTFPADQHIQQLAGGRWTQSGRTVQIRPAADDARVAPHANVVLTVTGTYRGSNPPPTAFVVNGMPCAVRVATPTLTAASTRPVMDGASGATGGTPATRPAGAAATDPGSRDGAQAGGPGPTGTTGGQPAATPPAGNGGGNGNGHGNGNGNGNGNGGGNGNGNGGGNDKRK